MYDKENAQKAGFDQNHFNGKETSAASSAKRFFRFFRLVFAWFKELLCLGNFRRVVAGDNRIGADTGQQAGGDARYELQTIHLCKRMSVDDALGQFRADAGEESQFPQAGLAFSIIQPSSPTI